MLAQLDRLLRPIRNAVATMVSRGILLLVDDGALLQALQARLLAGEVVDQVERFQDYGFSSHPHPGAECIALSGSGRRSNAVIIAVDDRRYRVRGMEQGEVCIYTDEGDEIRLMRGRTMRLTTSHLVVDAAEDVAFTTRQFSVQASERIDLTSPVLAMSDTDGGVASAEITGTVHVSEDVVADTISLRGHRHTGVQTGSGTTGTPVGG